MSSRSLLPLPLLLWATIAQAYSCAPEEARRLQGVVFGWDNDFLGRAQYHSDRWYSDGLHCAWSYKPGQDLPWQNRWAQFLGAQVFGIRRENIDGKTEPTAVGIWGLNTYTATHRKEGDPAKFGRPYAGMLTYGSGSYGYLHEGASLRALDLRIGVVGPASLAEHVQTGAHHLFHDPVPVGWRYQVRPRTVLQASLTEILRRDQRDWPWLPESIGVHGHARATVGTVKNLATAGVTFVWGERDRVFGAPDEGDFMSTDFNERRNYNTFDFFPLRGLTVFLQGQLTSVATNYLITGPTYGYRNQAELRHRTWMGMLGFSWRCGKRHRFEYLLKRRSPDFEIANPISRDKTQNYGEIRFVFDLDPSPGPERSTVRRNLEDDLPTAGTAADG